MRANRLFGLALLGCMLPLAAWAGFARAEVEALPSALPAIEASYETVLSPSAGMQPGEILLEAPPADADSIYYEPDQGFSAAGGSLSRSWQVLPDEVLFSSYLAGAKEPQFGSVWFYEKDLGWLWDIALGGRVGLLRYGSLDECTDAGLPEGWQVDFEGAALPRLDPEEDRDLVSVDFRAGIPITHRSGPWETKLAYYHLSSHIGDEFLLKNPGFVRVNYVRDEIVAAVACRWTDDLRVYAEAGWAFYTSGGAEPWEFQFGVDYSPRWTSVPRGAPFAAVNVHLREEVDYGGNVTLQAGWQWRGARGQLLRVGGHYLNGKSPQFQFFNEHEEQLGFGVWYDY